MKNLVAIMCLLTTMVTSAQSKMYTKTGVVQFEASVPSFEEVKAKNENVTAVLDSETGNLAALVLVKGFRFKNALMEEHFNENYMDSDAFPKATFKGSLNGFDMNAITSSSTVVPAIGTLSIHGKSKEVKFDMDIKKTSSGLQLNAELLLSPSDFGIEIPGIVKDKIAKEITMNFIFNVVPK